MDILYRIGLDDCGGNGPQQGGFPHLRGAHHKCVGGRQLQNQRVLALLVGIVHPAHRHLDSASAHRLMQLRQLQRIGEGGQANSGQGLNSLLGAIGANMAYHSLKLADVAACMGINFIGIDQLPLAPSVVAHGNDIRACVEDFVCLLRRQT